MILKSTKTTVKGQDHKMARDVQPYNIASRFAGWFRSRIEVSSLLLDHDLSPLCI